MAARPSSSTCRHERGAFGQARRRDRRRARHRPGDRGYFAREGADVAVCARNQGQIDETVAALRGVGAGGAGEAAARTADRLERAVASARRATADVVGFGSSPRDAHAVSVPYLMLLGVLAGGWMHALAVVAVAAHEVPPAEDAARLTLADFYGAHHLPRVHALAETVASGETA